MSAFIAKALEPPDVATELIASTLEDDAISVKDIYDESVEAGSLGKILEYVSEQTAKLAEPLAEFVLEDELSDTDAEENVFDYMGVEHTPSLIIMPSK